MAAERLTRPGGGVAVGGRLLLLLVGHIPRFPATGEATPAAGQRQVSLADLDDALDPEHWRIEHAEECAGPTRRRVSTP